MIVVETPSPGWLQHVFRCGNCAARVRFQWKDVRDKAWKARETTAGVWAIRARCVVCGNALAHFTQEGEPVFRMCPRCGTNYGDAGHVSCPFCQEAEMPVGDKTSDEVQSLVPCVLCGRGYPPAEMWPRPDGHICDECSMKVPEDNQ